MDNIISQNFKNVLKILISPILYKNVDNIIENIFNNSEEGKYF